MSDNDIKYKFKMIETMVDRYIFNIPNGYIEYDEKYREWSKFNREFEELKYLVYNKIKKEGK